MKKLLLIGAAILTFSSVTKAQSAGTPTTLTDAVHYYFNKMQYRTHEVDTTPRTPPNIPPNVIISKYPYYKIPASTFTGTSHMGNKFDCPGTLTITGAEGFLAKHPKTSQLSIKVTFYLCNMGSNGMPTLPPIDSVSSILSNTAVAIVGGNFANPHVMSGPYAILIRNMSTIAGDTVRLLRTTAKTATAYPGPTWNDKYGEGNGFIRYSGTFNSTTNFTATGFGVGTDYEFCLAPRVKIDLLAAELWPSQIINGDVMCTFTPITFTNTSCGFYTNRMYNLNEFYRKWSLPPSTGFVNTPRGGWPADSSICWKFDHEDDGIRGVKYLPAGGGSNTLVFYTDSVIYPNCSDQNQFRANFRGMIDAYRFDSSYSYKEQFTVCVNYCNGDTLGVKANGGYDFVKIFPNPTASGKVNLTGLLGKNTVSVYNLTGQLVYREAIEADKLTIDLSTQPNGNYLIKIVNDANQSRSVKIVKRTE